ncbi:molybdenum cofactor guanylyltransferase [Saccharibacillus sp. O23]|uniref:molybdenum cofactor guanylyltransferase n=1 Tax=Saccharibacillus sp. O23 TaxID=2009338 RepID=UPI000B4E6C53|nr:molybdenum cofactor guanylyltransferase [Saccharibacillus sp. O23]OWR32599.1 molybdenum cofactor guanylyltransferase [Saccharibacillus sp. O23]
MTKADAQPEDVSERTVGILLAGGLSRRYGSPKAFARYEGRLFHERAYEALSAACRLVTVSSAASLAERFPGAYDVQVDLPEVSGRGPLAGICTVMRRIPAERYLVLPCDMPRVGPRTIRRLAELAQTRPEADVAAVRAGDAFVPLLSVWRAGLADVLEQEISADRLSVMKLLAKLNTVWLDASRIDEDLRVFDNFNTPDAN